MKAKSSESYQTGTRVKSVSGSPSWFLKLVGVADAQKGEGVVNAHINLFFNRCTELEALECLTAENFLHETRKNGANALAAIALCAEELKHIPDVIEEHSDYDIRANARREAKLNAARNNIAEARKTLFEINEKILNGDSILHERVIKTREKAGSKIEAYIKGVRSGGLSGFERDIAFSEKAVEAYHQKHQKLDDAINREATAYYEREEQK